MTVLKKDQEFNKFVLNLCTRDQLWNKGVNIHGQSLGPYAYSTIHGGRSRSGELFAGKIAKGLRYDHVTLFDTGEFYKSFKLRLTGDYSIQIIANDKNDLERNYGEIIGLTDDNYEIVIKRAQEILKAYINKQLAGKV